MEIQKFSTGVQHIGIPTNDIETTVAFYEGLGFTTALRTINEAANEKVAFLQLGNLVIETYENKQAALCSGAIDHIALDVNHIDQLFASMKAEGYCMLDKHVNSLPFWEKGVRFFTIVGPNKEKLESCEKVK